MLKGAFKTSRRGVWLRNSLVVSQFTISIGLISGALIMGQQMDYIRTKQLGFDKENVLVIKQAGALATNVEAFKDELRTLPDVLDVGGTNAAPGAFFGGAVSLLLLLIDDCSVWPTGSPQPRAWAAASLMRILSESLYCLENERPAVIFISRVCT